MKQLRIVCGTTSPTKLIDTNGRHPSAGNTTNGINEQMDRHRPSGVSVMNTKDPMSKQKMSNICEPGPLKRAQGIKNFQIRINIHSLRKVSQSFVYVLFIALISLDTLIICEIHSIII